MPRRREVPKREILPDPKFGNVELSKFMNVIMEGGKKAVAERIIYGALDTIEKKTGKDPLEIFTVAINNVKPMVEVKSRRVGGANYQVPVEVRPVRRVALAMRWIREAAEKREDKAHRGTAHLTLFSRVIGVQDMQQEFDADLMAHGRLIGKLTGKFRWEAAPLAM